MKFLIFRKRKGKKSYEVYHKLRAKEDEGAFSEAAKYLSDNGSPTEGDMRDTFEVVKFISHPVRAKTSVLAANGAGTFPEALILRVLKKGE